MLAVNYTELRGNMKECMDKVSDDYETIIVTRKKNKNIVMMSEEAYNNMMENMHLMGNQTNYNWLMEFCPDYCPKSFSAYMRARSAQTAAFKEIQNAALQLGKSLE